MKLSELIKKYGDCEVSEELLGMIKLKGEWEPKEGEKYWFVSGGEVSNITWDYDPSDLFLLDKRNIYRTKEEAQFALNMYKFCKERSFKPDWEDFNQLKVGLCLGYDERKAFCSEYYATRRFSPFYYPSTEVAQEIIDKYTFEELAKYYGRV